MAVQSQHRMSAPTPSLGQLQQLTGEGRRFLVNPRSFPVRIGRGEDCQVQLAGEGIWERHVELRLNKSLELIVQPAGEATTMVNGESLTGPQSLRNGDVIELGLEKIQFNLGTVRQKKLGLREAITWGLLVALTAVQAALLVWLG